MMRRATPSVHGQAGFSLLEAIVAMVIMATGLLALYAWLSTNTQSLIRVQEHAHTLEDARSALALIETVNPMKEPTGERALGDMVVSWTSHPVVDRRHGTGWGTDTTPTVFDLGLYEMEVQVLRGTRQVKTFTVRRAGWEAVRALDTN